jgi:glutathione S-transferase
MMLTLYYAPNTCSLASHIALEEAGAVFALSRLDIAKMEHHLPDYLTINPKRRVPALVTPRGVLTETPVILAFIVQSYSAARLAPLDGAFAFAEVQAFNSYICSTLHVARAHRMRGQRWVDDPAAIIAMEKKVPETVSACYGLIEGKFIKGPWVMGDMHTTPICSRLRNGWRTTALLRLQSRAFLIIGAGCSSERP